ncbi:MAG TPA: DUF2207 domain-containing protein [Planctomycetota bacterium]|nr:DUF2207 domain-containing protein [Planctomycetota bacterium]
MNRIVTALALFAAVAQARSLAIEDFHSDITVQEDGYLTVTETLKVAFTGSWNGIYRFVPYRYTYPGGLRATLHLEVEAITDGEGNELWHDISHEDGNLKLKIAVPGAENATRTVVIRYRSRNTIRAYGEEEGGYGAHDELYWNVTGNGWPFPIRHASATVTLPGGVPREEVRLAAFTGAYGSRASDQQTEVLKDGRVRIATKAPLGSYEGLTIVVGFPLGHVQHPGRILEAWWIAQANWGALLPLALAVLMFVLWYGRGRDSLEFATIVPEFEAPFGLRPSEIGLLADESVDPHDITACIVDLAGRGYFDIDVTGEEPVFRRKKDWEKDTTLLRHEKMILDGLFRRGAKTGRAEQDRLGMKMDAIRSAVYDAAADGGYFRARPDEVRTRWTAIAAVAFSLSGIAALIWSTWWVALLALALSAIVTFPCARRMPRRTDRGMEALRRIRGMEEYLRTAEEERMRNFPRSYFEKLLPYAIALGIVDKWTRLFEALFHEPPQWYVGPEGAAFNTSFHGFLRSTRAATFYTPPRSALLTGGGGGGWSGGSGFSGGGGFGGGGFGGGGGGGW